MTGPRLEGAFLDGFDGGRRFALTVGPPPSAQARGSILAIQPFGDEANLCRRVIVAQAWRLAAAGWTTLMLDPFGTGDSDGRTQEATLAVWRADLLRASRLAREIAPGAFVLWGARMGALLAADIAVALDQIVSAFVFWQPPATGAAALDTLLKLAKVGAFARSGSGTARDGEDAGRGDASAPINLGGLRVARQLVADLSELSLQPPRLGEAASSRAALFLGIQRNAAGGMPAPKAISDLAGRWLSDGYLASLRVAQGEPFWSSMEPSDPVAAFEATEAFLATVHSHA